VRHSNQQVFATTNQYPSFKKKLSTTIKTHKRQNKNALKGIDLNQAAYQYFEGVDLMQIEGVSHATILSIISEIGLDGFKKFDHSKKFTSWLRLAPNNKISGGKILSNKVPKGSNRLKIALRNAANAIGNLKDTHLADFFKKVLYRKGRTAAVSATARKLAAIIWNMIVKKQPYQPPTQYLFLDQKRKMGLVKKIKKQIIKFEITGNDLGLATS
jgi:transposase